MKAKRSANVRTLCVALVSTLLLAPHLRSARSAEAKQSIVPPSQLDTALDCVNGVDLTTSYEPPAQAGYVSVAGSDGTVRFVASVRSDPMSFLTGCDAQERDVSISSSGKCLSHPERDIFLTDKWRFRIHYTKPNQFSLTLFDGNEQPISVGGNTVQFLEPVHLTGWWGKEGVGWLATPATSGAYWKFFVYLQPQYENGKIGPEKNYRIEYFEGDLCKEHVPIDSLPIKSNYPNANQISAAQGGVGNGGEPPPRH